MKISVINNTQNFGSRNKNIRIADDIHRRARLTFPVLSATYVDEFYGVTKDKNNKKAQKLFSRLDNKVGALREVTDNPTKYGITPDELKREAPYSRLLNGIDFLKVANCKECAVVALAGLLANGYYNSSRVNLGLEVKFINPKTKEEEYNKITSLDHSFVITTLDKKSDKQKDKIVVDNWLNFTDSVSGAIERFKKIYNEDYIKDIIAFNRSMFRVEKAERTGELINPDDYEIKTKMVFCPADNLSEAQVKDLAHYARLMYDDLVIRNN